MTFLIYSFLSVYCDILLGMQLFKNLSGNSITKKQFFIISLLGINVIFVQYILKDHSSESIVNLLVFLSINWCIAVIYKINLRKRLQYLVVYLFFSIVFESISFYLLNSLFLKDVSRDFFLLVGTFMTSIFKAFFVMVIIKETEKNESTDVELPNAIFFSLMIIPFLSTFILIFILYLDYYFIDFSGNLVFAILIAIFLLNIATFVIFNGIHTYYKEHVRTLNILNNIEKEVNHYHNLEKSMENIRLIKHDLKNNMITVLGFLVSGNVSQAINYLNELVESTENNDLIFFTKNEILNFLLNNKLNIAEKNKIKVLTNILVPEKIKIENDIIGIILGNILDNAINACNEMESDNKFIDIKMKVYQDKLLIRVENTYDQKSQLSKKTKSNGLGLISVKKLIKKKNGMYKVDLNKTTYIVTVMIFNII